MNSEEHFTEGERLLRLASECKAIEDAVLCSSRASAHFSAALAASTLAAQAKTVDWMREATAAFERIETPAAPVAATEPKSAVTDA